MTRSDQTSRGGIRYAHRRFLKCSFVENRTSFHASHMDSKPSPRARTTLTLTHACSKVWDTEDLSNVSEVLSLRDVRVGVATVLAPPCAPHPDRHDSSRPLLAMVDADLASDASVRILSLHTGRFLDVSVFFLSFPSRLSCATSHLLSVHDA